MWNVGYNLFPPTDLLSFSNFSNLKSIIQKNVTLTQKLQVYFQNIPFAKYNSKTKGNAFPLQAWTGPEGSRKLRLPHFVTMVQDGGRFSALRTGRPPLPPRKYFWYLFLLEAESTPGP